MRNIFILLFLMSFSLLYSIDSDYNHSESVLNTSHERFIIEAIETNRNFELHCEVGDGGRWCRNELRIKYPGDKIEFFKVLRVSSWRADLGLYIQFTIVRDGVFIGRFHGRHSDLSLKGDSEWQLGEDFW